MRVGLTLSGRLLSKDGASFASQLGVKDVVVHLVDYQRNADNGAYLSGSSVGPVNGDCIGVPMWSYDDLSAMVAMLAPLWPERRSARELLAGLLVRHPAGWPAGARRWKA